MIPLSVEQGGNIYYYHKDGLGSITELTNAAGSVVKTYRYNSFGEIYSQSGAWFSLLLLRAENMTPRAGYITIEPGITILPQESLSVKIRLGLTVGIRIFSDM